MESDWSLLAAGTPWLSGFQSFAWIAACRAAIASPRTALFTLVVRDRSEIVAILPTALDRSGNLTFLGEGVSNYLGPVYQPSRLDEIMHHLAGFLASEPRIALIDLRGLREDSPFLAGLQRHTVAGWSKSTVVRTATCPYVDLSAGWEAVMKGHRAGRDARLARREKALGRFGAVTFLETGDARAVEAALPTMFELFSERWAGRHESGGFADRYRSFHERAARTLAAAGHVCLSLLMLDGEIIAFSYGVRARSVTASYVLGHRNALNACAPGTVLLMRLLEAACQRGDREYDFSLGEEEYKTRWATGARGVFRLLRWRHRSTVAIRGLTRAAATRARTTARSLSWLRRLRREGVHRVAFGTRALGAEPDTPGLGAGAPSTWNVHRVRAGESSGAIALGNCRYGTMMGHMSPRLLRLAFERSFRGDTLHTIHHRNRFIGLVWRAADSRRDVITGGRQVERAERVYYHPIPARDADLEALIEALVGCGEDHDTFVLVSPRRFAGSGIVHLGTFQADSSLRGPTAGASRRRSSGSTDGTVELRK